MKKKFIAFMIPILAISLSIGSFIPQVIADSISDKQDANRAEIQEFTKTSVVQSSSTTTICHLPKGNPSNSYEIVVSTSSLTAHLRNGDFQGNC